MKKIVFIFLIILSAININLTKEQKILKHHPSNYLCDFYTKYTESTSPIIMLNGEKDIYINTGSNYQELGVKAIDNCDGDITRKVKITGYVNTDKPGIYKLKYQVQDNNKNINETERNIFVEDKRDDKGTIYLTFDDGPSNSITPKILDILKKENIKATFFVINHHTSTDYLIKRIHNEGHTIGLHSYTHDYSYIYSSADNYFNDLNKIEKKVYKLTGMTSDIIRFPGGSSNLVSKKYTPKIMTNLAKLVEEKGYVYYDWNVESKDAGGVKSSEEVYYNVINSLSKDNINIILLHDFEKNYYTLEALPKIIEYAKQNGYTFNNITNTTTQIKHSINN